MSQFLQNLYGFQEALGETRIMRQHVHCFSWWNRRQVPQKLHKLHKPWAPLGSPELLSTPLSSLSTFRTWNLSGTCYRFRGTCMIFEKPWAKRRVMNSDCIASHGGTCCRFRGACTYFTRKSPKMVKQSCTKHHRTVDFPMKKQWFFDTAEECRFQGTCEHTHIL